MAEYVRGNGEERVDMEINTLIWAGINFSQFYFLSYFCVHICMYLCMYVQLYVCTYVYIYSFMNLCSKYISFVFILDITRGRYHWPPRNRPLPPIFGQYRHDCICLGDAWLLCRLRPSYEAPYMGVRMEG